MKIISVRWLLAIFALMSFYLMMTLKYDPDFRFTAVLPLTYFFVLTLIVRNYVYNSGLGASALFYFYTFRMCLLPLVCALGNFYLEPDKNDYIRYYNWGIVLICIECIIVFLSLKYFTNYFKKKEWKAKIIESTQSKHQIIKWVVVLLTLAVIILQAGLKVDYYTPITSQADEILMSEIAEPSTGAWWYITDMLSTWWRPLITITLISFLLRKNVRYSYFWIVIVAIVNIYFMSDRRIHALLVGGFALYYAMFLTKSVFVKRTISMFLVAGALTTLFFGFYGSATSNNMEVVARTFQRYFSGPTLNALSLRVFDSIGIRPMEFICLFLNDFQTFTAVYGTIQLPDYYMSAYGMSYGLWTPVTVGSLSYFGVFFPLPLVFFVYYIKRCDYYAAHISSLTYKMMYYFIGVCVSCYMVMYTVELIFYFIIVTGTLFRALVYYDQRVHFFNKKLIIRKI